MEKNIMQQIEIEKMVVHAGGIDDKLEKEIKLLEMITKRKVLVTKAKKRIPTFGISPGKKAGCKVTIRDTNEIINLLKRFFAASDNKIKAKQITNNHFSFGLKEYIEVPGLEYMRDIGIIGFEVDVVFSRKGKRVINRKVKKGKYPERQVVKREEIVNYLTKKLNVEIVKNETQKQQY